MSDKNITLQSLEQFHGSIRNSAYACFENLLFDKHVIIRHVPARKTKLGDFRHFRDRRMPEITINQNLHPDALTFILAHEIAHYLVYVQHKKRTEPHGKEWKQMFSSILIHLINGNAFSEALLPHIKKFVLSVKGTVSRGSKLHEMLFPQEETEGLYLLEELHTGALFQIPSNGKVYEKGEKRRTRYVCKQVSNKRYYLVSRLLRVKLFG